MEMGEEAETGMRILDQLPAFIDIQNIEDLMGFAGVLDFEGFEVVPGFVDMQNFDGFEAFNIDPNDFFPDHINMDPGNMNGADTWVDDNGGTYRTKTTTHTSPNGTVTTTTVTTYNYEYRR